MESVKIPLENTGILNKISSDYYLKNEKLQDFSSGFSDLKSISDFLKSSNFTSNNREILVTELKRQYHIFDATEKVKQNINALTHKNVYTVTTGHQLCLFTGPAYFIYKIISVIQIAKKLNEKFPEYKFVPVYWMASEDHDKEEINHTYCFGKKIIWETNQGGKVGSFNLQGIQDALNEFLKILGNTDVSRYIGDLLHKALKGSKNLVDFTRFFLNEIFGVYGLLVIDGDSIELKKLFIEELKKELLNNISFKNINSTNQKLIQSGYQPQVNVREINLFYISQGLRERIVFEKDHYHVLNTDLKFTENEIIQLVENNPDKLSPNVITRPLYQQKILPNIIYCGGPAEIAYWLQLKSNFKSFEINFPVLALRNFIGILNQNIVDKWKNLGFELKDIFHSTDELKKTWLSREQKEISLSDSKQKAQFLFAELKSISSEYDSSLNASVDAELQKLISAVDSIEKKINRSIKRQNEVHLNQIEKIKSILFPDGNFQERKENFISLINNYGIKIIDEMIVDDQYEISGLYLKIL